MGVPEKVQQQITSIARSFPEIEEIRLFGSRSHGDHQSRSDIDLAIMAQHLSNYDWLIFSEKLEEDVETLLKIDAVRWENASEDFKDEINRHYTIIYSKRQQYNENSRI